MGDQPSGQSLDHPLDHHSGRQSGCQLDQPEREFETGSVMSRVVEGDQTLVGFRLMRLAAIAELDSSRDFEYDGYPSTTAFLIHRCGMTPGEARREVFLARSLEYMPYAVKSAYACHISISQVEMLAHARSRHPDAFERDEATLVDSICDLTVARSRRVIDYWCQVHDEPPDVDEPEPSRAFLSRTLNGRWRLDGDLSPLAGETLSTALDELMSEIVDSIPKDELASASVRRGEALEELARRHLDSAGAPTDHGNRPHVTAIVDWRVLSGRAREGSSELLDETVIDPSTARRLACDAVVCRLITGPDGEILDLGRSTRTVSPAQWRALRVRDRHCRWPGCTRPASWCDAHHVRHWADGGPSDLGNFVLLCRHHHTLIHRGGWKLVGTPGHLIFTRPDGTVLANGPP